MKNSDLVICGAKIITPYKMDSPTDMKNIHSHFEGMEDFFPQGLPQRLAGLDRGTKFLLAAVKGALRDSIIDNERLSGVAISTFLGSNSSRLQFLKGVLDSQKSVANPIIFKTTVPSIAAGAVAILCQFCGPTTTCIGHGEAGLAALHNAALLIKRGVARNMIVGGFEDLPPELIDHIPGKVMGAAPWREGAAALLLRDASEVNSAAILAGVAAINVCGYGIQAKRKEQALCDVMKASISSAEDISIKAVISAGKPYGSVEKAAVPDVPVIDIVNQWGETLGMSGIIKLIAALEKLSKPDPFLKETNRRSGIIVNGIGISGTAYSVILTANHKQC